MNFFSKTIFFLLIFLLIFNSSGFFKKPGFFNLTPQKAEAVWWSTVFNQIADYAKDIWEWVQKNYQNIMRDIIAKRIMDYIVDQTVEWIQGGGKPKFVTDWNGFVKDAGKIAFDSVIKEIGASGLCSPFGLQVKLALLPVQKFSKQISCTLDKVVSNINNFYVDFSVGGWDGYLVSLEPQNNFYGAMLLANDELVKKIQESQSAATKEAESGKGFLGVKKCVSADNDKSKWIQECMAGPGWVDQQTAMDICTAHAEQAKISCSKEETTTPGAVVGDAIGNAVTTDSQWAANISSWVSALVNALINRLLKEGLSSLSKSDPNAVPDYYPPEYDNVRTSYYEQDKARMISEIKRASANSVGVDTSATIQEALTYASSTVAMLLEMQSFGCSVDANEIVTAQSNANNLAAQSENQSNGASEADLLISDIQATDPSDAVAWSSILDRYNDFMNRDKQNLSNLNNIGANYDPQEKAQTKLNAEISTNNAVSARLATCKKPIVINNDDATTSNPSVSLTLNATSSISGISGVTEMTISNDSNFLSAVWETYSKTKTWALDTASSTVGIKNVYVKFRNTAVVPNVISNPFSDDINLQ